MMRRAEWIQLVFVSLLALVAWIRPIPSARRWRVVAFAALAAVLILLARLSASFLPPLASSVVRDWLPAALLLVPYWQTGLLFVGPDHQLQEKLLQFDQRLFARLDLTPASTSVGPALGLWLELAYVLAYPLVPLGLAALYLSHRRWAADSYWQAVLLASYVCYGITLFVPALPPRMLSSGAGFRSRRTAMRKLNEGILDRAGIQAITFPSAHVAASAAAALFLLRLNLPIGLIFLSVALSIAVATVMGGYHYAADALLALLISALAFASTLWQL
ncbi:MAG TPA: phosphatase PAP2 family protein [Terriglobales bacterium]|nr:phosphatase PAP2 family protein [Terriglobales bacterium]